MKTFLSRLATGAATLGLVASAITAPAFAANDTESIAISPTNVRIQLDPGKEVTGKFKVINDGQTDYDVLVYARPYSVKGESYDPVFEPVSTNLDSFSWIQFDKNEFRLNKGENTEVGYTIRVPANASSGGHYAVMFAETQPQQADKGSVVRKKRVGQIVYATVGGSNKLEGNVESYEIPFLQNNVPLVATSTVKNTGNADFVDNTKITVKDVFGSEKYSQARDLEVLPNQPRKITYTWKDSSSFGLYNVTISHDFLGKTTSRSSYVLMVPVWVLIAVVLLIVGAVAYAVAKRRKA